MLPTGRGRILAVDLLGPLIKSTYGYTCILVAVDVFTKFVKLYALRRSTSRACMTKLRNYVRLYGRPHRVLSDNGPQFRSKLWKHDLRQLNIKEIHTSIRNPRGNPSERYVRIVVECLRILCMSKHNSWVQCLKKAEDFINYQYSSMTKELPIELHCRSKCMLELETYVS